MLLATLAIAVIRADKSFWDFFEESLTKLDTTSEIKTFGFADCSYLYLLKVCLSFIIYWLVTSVAIAIPKMLSKYEYGDLCIPFGTKKP